MIIDEVIERAEERVRGNDQYVKEHAQFADLLRGLKLARTEIDLLKTLRDGFKADAQKYKAENAKLKEQVTKLQADWESERDYANQMEAKEKRAVAENAKLRELVAHYEHAVTVHDVKPAEVLEWSIICDALRKELGME